MSRDSSAANDVDREVFLLFSVLDERKSHYLQANLEKNVHSLHGPRGTAVAVRNLTAEARAEGFAHLTRDPYFKKYSKKHTINGRALCTLEGLDDFTSGQRVRWHLLSIGDEVDVHTPGWQGHSITVDGRPEPSLALMPSSMTSVDITVKPGTWTLWDLGDNHFRGGARAKFVVLGGSNEEAKVESDESKIARHYIAADEVEWDYAPAGRNVCADRDFDEDEAIFTEGPSHHRIGTKYVKAVYREYLDDRFEYLKWGDASRFNGASAHLGILGPVVRALVGETIELVFRNNLRGDTSLVAFAGALSPYSVEPVNDIQKNRGTTAKPWVVVPGGEVRIRIKVGEDAGPKEGSEHNSVAYMYGSDVDPIADTHAGLVGLFIVHAKDAGHRHTSPPGIHREFVGLFATFDENLSRYARMNALRYAVDAETVDYLDPEWKLSNRMASINGFLHCNGPIPVAKQHQHVRWYMLSIGNSHDIRGPAISGYTYSTSADKEHQVALMAPGMVRAVDMTVDVAGTWLVRDAVHTNQVVGMQTLFEVGAVLHPGA